MSKNGKRKIPTPLDPNDPLNEVIYSLGSQRKSKFKVFPGLDGIPHYASGVHLYKESDPEHLRPQRGGKVHCEIYDIGDEQQRKQYELTSSLVYSMATKGKAIIVNIERRFVEQKATWLVYFEWIELFTYDPTKRKPNGYEPGILKNKG